MFRFTEQLTNSLLLEMHILTFGHVATYWRCYSCAFFPLVSIYVTARLKFD